MSGPAFKSNRNTPPVCTVIAGPNGAGKTTFALKYLRGAGQCDKFVNADLIAAGLSPLDPERESVAAGRSQRIESAARVFQDLDFSPVYRQFRAERTGRVYTGRRSSDDCRCGTI